MKMYLTLTRAYIQIALEIMRLRLLTIISLVIIIFIR